MKAISLATVALIMCSASLSLGKSKSSEKEPSIEHGRYLIQVTGCNDCHTPMFAPKNGNVPEKEWLIGSPVGWTGPWGTTYPSNLRQTVSRLTEEQWAVYMKNLKARPPMPFWAVNAMTDRDSRSVYRFIRSLGEKAQAIPEALPPGKTPNTPYVNFDVIVPK